MFFFSIKILISQLNGVKAFPTLEAHPFSVHYSDISSAFECVFILPARAHIKFARTEMILSLSTRVRASLGTFFWTFVSFYQKRGMHNGH